MPLVTDLRVPLSTPESELPALAAARLRVAAREVRALSILRKSVDARKRQDVHFQLQVSVSLEPSLEARILQRGDAGIRRFAPVAPVPLTPGSEEPRGRILVAGLGPAGLFAAYWLARQGYRPLVVERGRPVAERTADVQRFWAGGPLEPESNVMFGEGGAGTFSDGKLTTRIKDPRAASVLRVLVEHGAPAEIAYLAKPHIGTDRLRLAVLVHRRGTDSNFNIPWAVNLHCGSPGRIETLRLWIFKDVAPHAQRPKILSIGPKARFAAQDHKGHFPIPGFKRQVLTVGQLNNAKFQILQRTLANGAQWGIAVMGDIGFLVVHGSPFLSMKSAIISSAVVSQSATMP